LAAAPKKVKIKKHPDARLVCVVETAAVTIGAAVASILDNQVATSDKPTEAMAKLADLLGKWYSKIPDSENGRPSIARARQKGLVKQTQDKLTDLKGTTKKDKLMGGSKAATKQQKQGTLSFGAN
jgi:hypothetical protein